VIHCHALMLVATVIVTLIPLASHLLHVPMLLLPKRIRRTSARVNNKR
jgi:hypothetical protein